ncbi:serine dehydratase subunit alpha family protein [Acidaminobacter sp. JC074]|uniref:L-cysteine desulfidase family protein n=1 Tax=Acidaminobacter sp. JC074 TaxID=2530199 RepID=UPI001F0EF9F1|nr:L-serine ammonia-lyase, iron-sulfur-dependent, subunit alpha [Acidaminobacter sp. JC074]MCH4888227.1 serine dehydratase subunit alpha family protein [Acidaminobacter sp. JC074]
MRIELIDLLKREVKPAMGCTEPVAVTLAVAKARQAGQHTSIDKIKVDVSPNIFKNGLSVGIPKTDEVGIAMASAIGAVSGDAELGLKIYETIEIAKIKDAKDLMKSGKMEVGIADTDEKVYVSVEIESAMGKTELVLSGLHNHFSYIKHNEHVLLDDPYIGCSCDFDIRTFTVNELLDEAEHATLDEIGFLLDGLKMNATISAVGLEQPLGLGVGFNSKKAINDGLLGDDLANKAMYYTAAASDARMSGISLPVMSSNGSGNNGLTAILPLLAFRDQYDTSDEKMAKALAMSHLLNCYIKSEIGRLSALCSCGISAATGSGAAITWLLGGSRQEIAGTIQNMIANLSGMICDGAKNSCALKLATAASTGVKAAIWSLNGTISSPKDGIVGGSVEESIKNLGVLSAQGMKLTDSTILSIMREMQ